ISLYDLAFRGYRWGNLRSCLFKSTDAVKWITIGNYLFRRKFPCSPPANSLFGAEQGIRGSALELQRKWTPEPAESIEMGRDFRHFPVIFPVLRECRGVRAEAWDGAPPPWNGEVGLRSFRRSAGHFGRTNYPFFVPLNQQHTMTLGAAPVFPP